MRPRLIAFYLPQYHPIPCNDAWWGKGYTEWRSVTTAKPLFKGHYQPHIPADLGYYDLRLPEIRKEQAELAKEAGIEGFCYWHYWMGNGTRLLERPFNEVLASGEPDFPFCLGWANHNWTNKNWTKQSSLLKEKNLIEMHYSIEDYKAHFYAMLPAFKDKRYITIDERPLFYIFAPKSIPNPREFINLWNELATQNGLNKFYFIGMTPNLGTFLDEKGKPQLPRIDEAGKFYQQILNLGFDGVNSRGDYRAEYMAFPKYKTLLNRFVRRFFKIALLKKFDYKDILPNLYVEEDKLENVYPTVIPNWDRSPRAGKDAVIYHNSTPELFKKNLIDAIELIKDKSPQHQIIFVKSWNEWGEGNHLEPDVKWGHEYLKIIKETLREIEAK